MFLKRLYFVIVLSMMLFSVCSAGMIKRGVWVPIAVGDIQTFIPYTQLLPDKDNDGIEDELDRPVADPKEIAMDINASGILVELSGHDNDSPITYEIIRQPEHGRLDGTAPHLTYTPQSNYRGDDYFTYRVSDGVHYSSVVRVVLHIGTVPVYGVEDLAQASRFLSRATFGSTMEEIQRLKDLGDYKRWIEEQFDKAPSYHIAWAHAHAIGVNGVGDLRTHPEDWNRYSDALGLLQRDAWWDIAVNGEDQLRQRVAFALSEIMVISRNGSLQTFPDARMSYYDILVKDAFSNFEIILHDVTYHPAMGKYLSYLGNEKADPVIGNHPDENYAREVMQLFSIGLYQLNPDGTQKRQNGKPLATYDQHDIQQMAKVFTGLSDDNGEFETEAAFSSFHARTSPMKAFDSHHDTSEKKILLAHETIPAGGTTYADVNLALHKLFMHPNVGPFIARRLIQRLVTSNPSAGYIERVASAFNDNGKGIRGDMKAVIKAILLDDEALHGIQSKPTVFGKFREPLLFVSHLFRAFHAQNGEHILKQEDTQLYRYRSFNFNGTGMTRQEGPLEALTVFNYFTPDDAPYILKKDGIYAPELELYGKGGIDDVLMGLITKNGFVYQLFDITAELQLQEETALVSQHQYAQFLDKLDLLLTGGTLRQETKNAIIAYMQDHHGDEGMNDEKLVRYVIGLVMTSPEYALQR